MDASPVWTPDIVGETLIDAARWCLLTAGRTGPARVKSLMPDLDMSMADRLAEGWSSVVGEDQERRLRRAYAAGQISQLEQAIRWPIEYLDAEPGARRVLQLWLRCKVTKLRFDAEVKAKKWSRATAYRQRDRALSAISMGLDRDRITLRAV